MSTPCALITSCTTLKASELVKKILSKDDLPPTTPLLENICAYPWHIETKYYSADVSLCTSDVRTIGDIKFANSVQAFVAVFDTTQKSSFDQVCLWLPYLRELNPPVRILVCNQCLDDDVVSRDVAIGWCLDNGFELVELEPVLVDEDDDEEDDFKETVGVQRVIEALSCHSWPNLVMKDKPTFGLAYLEQLRSEVLPESNGDKDPSNAHNDADDSDDGWSHFVTSDSATNGHYVSSSQQHTDNGCETATGGTNQSTAQRNALGEKTENLIDSIIGDDTTAITDDGAMDQESFEKLFDQLRVMKAAAAGMNTDQRKKYAEQVTMQFWQALGGDVDEFDGLSSDSD